MQCKEDKKQNKKAKKTLNIILIIIGISTFVFTVMMCVFFALFQAIPDTLCERFYTVVVGELGVAGIIQVVKTICTHKYSNVNSDTEEYNDDLELDNEGDDFNE